MKNVIITGANSGLGFETAKKIAKDKEYRIILACRNAEKAETSKNRIITETGNDNVEFMILDTSLLSSVRALAGPPCKEKHGGPFNHFVNAAFAEPYDGSFRY